MSEADSSPGERSLRLENSLMTEILTQDPRHLTQDELILRMKGSRRGADHNAVVDALQELDRSGQIRFNGEVVEPTFAVLRTAEIFDLP